MNALVLSISSVVSLAIGWVLTFSPRANDSATPFFAAAFILCALAVAVAFNE